MPYIHFCDTALDITDSFIAEFGRSSQRFFRQVLVSYQSQMRACDQKFFLKNIIIQKWEKEVISEL